MRSGPYLDAGESAVGTAIDVRILPPPLSVTMFVPTPR